jgi:hypothetical protein
VRNREVGQVAHGADERGEGVIVGAKGAGGEQGAEHGDGGRGIGRAGVRRDHGVVKDGVSTHGRDGVEEGHGGRQAARGGVRRNEGGGGYRAWFGAEEELGGGEIGGEGVEVDEAEGEMRVRRRVEERGGDEVRVEAAERAEEGG